MFALALAAAALRRHNYAVYAALMTPLFVLMAESTSGDWHLARTRIISTLLGGLVALVGSFGFWPQRGASVCRPRSRNFSAWRARCCRPPSPDSPSRRPGAKRASRSPTPTPPSSGFSTNRTQDHEAEALMAIRSQLRRIAGAIVALSAGGRLPDALLPAVQAAADALAVMAQAVEEGRPPPPLAPFPTSLHAERLARPVEVIHGALGRLAG